MKKRILLIDKDGNKNPETYLLKEGYEVDALCFLKTGLYKLFEQKIKYDLIVIEIMLSYEGLFSKEESSDGLLSGICFFKKYLKDLQVPVLFWTWNHDFKENVLILKEENPESKIGFAGRTMQHEDLVDTVNNFLK